MRRTLLPIVWLRRKMHLLVGAAKARGTRVFKLLVERHERKIFNGSAHNPQSRRRRRCRAAELPKSVHSLEEVSGRIFVLDLANTDRDQRGTYVVAQETWVA